MAGVELRDYQEDAVRQMRNGCILCGGVGSGKSRTSLAYYYVRNGGELGTNEYVPMDDVNIKDLYIITTARKRDTFEWEEELSPFLLSTNKKENLYTNKVVIDSWNNIKKYADVKDVCLYALIDRVMKCIEHCATARAYGRFREAGVKTKMDDVAAGIAKSKEEKDHVEKRLD